MSVNRVAYSITRPWASADFTAHTYTQVYAGVDATVILNGQPAIFMAATTYIDFSVGSVSADTANVFVLGVNKDVVTGTQIIGGSFTGNRGF